MGGRRTWFWKLALVASAAIWGGAFVVVKGALDDISPAWLLALRFASRGTRLLRRAKRTRFPTSLLSTKGEYPFW